MLRQIFSFLFLLCVLFPTMLFADTEHERGDKYASVRGKIQECFACHGEAGASNQPTFPILAGQHLYYLYIQMRDFKSGLRANDIMGPIAAPLGKEEMMLIAEYFSEQEWPEKNFTVEPEKTRVAKKVIGAGQCVQCHLGGFQGASGVPRLAGQFPEYLNKTLLDFKNKVRNNNPAKGSLLATFSVDEINAVAGYLGSLKSDQD